MHQGGSDPLPLPVRDDRDRTHHPDAPNTTGRVVEVALAEEHVRHETAIGVLGDERATIDPAVGTPDVIDDLAFVERAERGVVDGTDGLGFPGRSGRILTEGSAAWLNVRAARDPGAAR
jgi:hypothetical protein